MLNIHSAMDYMSGKNTCMALTFFASNLKCSTKLKGNAIENPTELSGCGIKCIRQHAQKHSVALTMFI